MKWILWLAFLVLAGTGAVVALVFRKGQTPPSTPAPAPQAKAPEATPVREKPATEPELEESTEPGIAPEAETVTAPAAPEPPADEARPVYSGAVELPGGLPVPAPAAEPAPPPPVASEPVPAVQSTRRAVYSGAVELPRSEPTPEPEDVEDEATDQGSPAPVAEDVGDEDTLDDEPTTPPVPTPEPEPEPAAEPEAPASKPEGDTDSTFRAEAVEVKGVTFQALQAMRAVSLLNNSDEEALMAVGLKGRSLKIVLEGRPFANVEAIAETKGMGVKTLELIAAACE